MFFLCVFSENSETVRVPWTDCFFSILLSLVIIILEQGGYSGILVYTCVNIYFENTP